MNYYPIIDLEPYFRTKIRNLCKTESFKQMKRILILLILTSIAFPSLEAVVAKPSFTEKTEKRTSKNKLKKPNKRKSRKKRNTSFFENIGKRRKKNPKARGLILKFHRWPNARQNHLIFKILEKENLKKTKTVNDFKMWVFEWRSGNLKSFRRAQRACKKLSKLSAIVSYCEPNSLLPVNDSGNRKSFVRELKSVNSELPEAGFNVDCPYCKENSTYDLIQNIVKDLNVRNCGLVSDSQGLMKTDGVATLSDYWAQEMIGADLLKEELKNIPAPKKEPFIAVFDDTMESHAELVGNLISDKGFHAVLPKLQKQKMPLVRTVYPENYIETASKMKTNPPSFINNSMGWVGSQTVYEALQSLSPPSVVVIAAGNDFPSELEKEQSQASKDFNAILVGSFSPEGFVSNSLSIR